MGKLIVSNQITVNGAFESPSPDEWLVQDEDSGGASLEQLRWRRGSDVRVANRGANRFGASNELKPDLQLADDLSTLRPADLVGEGARPEGAARGPLRDRLKRGRLAPGSPPRSPDR
jgi:hypothetical protein